MTKIEREAILLCIERCQFPSASIAAYACEVQKCSSPSSGYYQWGEVGDQQGQLCASHAKEVWEKSPPHVRDRFVITPLAGAKPAEFSDATEFSPA